MGGTTSGSSLHDAGREAGAGADERRALLVLVRIRAVIAKRVSTAAFFPIHGRRSSNGWGSFRAREQELSEPRLSKAMPIGSCTAAIATSAVERIR